MKILQVFDLFSLPHGGGTAAILHQLSRALSDRGHEVTVYTSDYDLDDESRNALPGIDVYPFHCLLGGGGFYFMPGLIAKTRRNIKDFDIVHLHCSRSFQNIVLHHYAKNSGIPYVLDTHGSLPRKVTGERTPKWMLRKSFDVAFGKVILRDACQVIAETEVGVEEYRQFGVSDDKIALIPPPFSTEEFDNLPEPGLFRSRYNIGDKKIVLFLGRIHQIKGLDFLVESFYELTKIDDNAMLAIVGTDDGFKTVLDDIISRRGISDRILFTGFLGGDDKLSALVDADVVAQTSVYEQGAWAPFEAVLCGTPIIVTAHTGAGEDVRRLDAGYLVEYDNKTEMAELIRKVFEDPAEGREKAKKAALYIRNNMSMSRRIEDYERLYGECVEENKRAVRSKK